MKVDRHKGKLASKQSFMKVTPENIVVTAIKKNGEAIIVRLYETIGKPVSVKITFSRNIQKVYETNLLEDKLTQLSHWKNIIEFKIGKFEIKTLALNF